MEKKKIIVAHYNTVDSQGDIIMPGAIKDCTVPLTKNFNRSLPPIGTIEVKNDSNSLVAEIEVTEDMKGLYPAIGFEIIAVDLNDKNQFEIKEMKLMEVSLCINPNADSNIKPIE